MSFFRIILVASLTLVTTGCASEKRIETIIRDAFPSDVEVEVKTSCTRIMGPAVALFSYEGAELDTIAEHKTLSGTWTHSDSLGEFQKLADEDVHGPGVWATILDGKKCFRGMTDKANEMLFHPNPGLYFHSNNREVVIILPETTPGEGVLFVQAY